MPKLIALRPLSGDYGTVHPGQSFVCDEQTALSLESRGLAERVRESGFIAKMLSRTENKMLAVQENKDEPPAVTVSSDHARYPEPPRLVPELPRRKHARR